MEQRPVPAVRAIIPDAEGRVLLLKRRSGGAGGDCWCLPGGKVDYGETVEAAVRREVEEETSLVCTAVRFLFYQDSPPLEPGGMHCVNFYFECAVSGDLRLNEESSEVRRVDARTLSQLSIAFRNDEGLRRYFAGPR
jgi:8-oxo-dGTP diphosphatase